MRPAVIWTAILMMALVFAPTSGDFTGWKGLARADAKKECSLVRPEDVIKVLSSPRDGKPVLLHIGFGNFYRAAHIPGSRYAGPASDPDGVELLKKEVRGLPRDKEVVLYCGCCPMNHCPNIHPACTIMKDLGFTQVRILDLPRSFEHDWIDRGYPIEKGGG